MPLIPGTTAPTFDLPNGTFTGLASPSRGSAQTAVWRIHLNPHAAGAPHTLTHEEVFVATKGAALAVIGDDEHVIREGDALVVPADVSFALSNPHGEPFEAVAVFPVGGKAALPGGEPFTPPWAE